MPQEHEHLPSRAAVLRASRSHPLIFQEIPMKRLALVAAVFAVAACSSGAKPAADTGSAMKAAAPAADTSAMKMDTTKKDSTTTTTTTTTSTTTTKMDTTKKDTTKKAMDTKKK
jgi:hypothetical protein